MILVPSLPVGRPQSRASEDRPTAPLRVVAGREREAQRANAVLTELWSLTHDEQACKDAERSLIRAGILEVAR